jgi:hypothetical protein
MSWSQTWDIRASPGSRPQGGSVGPRRRSALAVAGTRRRRPARRRFGVSSNGSAQPARCGHRRWRCGSGGCLPGPTAPTGWRGAPGAGRSAARASSAVLRVVRASMPCCRSRQLADMGNPVAAAAHRRELTSRLSRTTHGAPEAIISACVVAEMAAWPSSSIRFKAVVTAGVREADHLARLYALRPAALK